MNKKQFRLLSLLLAVVLFVGCSQKEVVKEKEDVEVSRVVEIQECGLRYTAPDSWMPYESTNIVPLSSATNKGDIFAHVQFNYATDESMEKMNSFELKLDTTELLIPFGEIFVINETKLNSEGATEAFAKYDTKKEVTVLNGYHYFLMSDYNGSKGKMTEEEKAVYEELKKSIPDIEKSISAFAFDEALVAEKMDKLERTITFASSTLEGEEINSTVFDEYDLTIVNFWGSYCYPDINETQILQELNERLKKDYPRVNLIQVVIDTPEESAQATALKVKQEGGGEFTSIMTDNILAGWITDNLQGLPTTIFVDNDATMIGEQMEGVKTLEEYITATEETLQQLNLSGK